MEQNPQQSPRPEWKGMERRQSLGQHQGEERRKTHGVAQVGYRDDGTPGVNAEEPSDEQEERELQQERGPDPRIPK